MSTSPWLDNLTWHHTSSKPYLQPSLFILLDTPRLVSLLATRFSTLQYYSLDTFSIPGMLTYTFTIFMISNKSLKLTYMQRLNCFNSSIIPPHIIYSQEAYLRVQYIHQFHWQYSTLEIPLIGGSISTTLSKIVMF